MIRHRSVDYVTNMGTKYNQTWAELSLLLAPYLSFTNRGGQKELFVRLLGRIKERNWQNQEAKSQGYAMLAYCGLGVTQDLQVPKMI